MSARRLLPVPSGEPMRPPPLRPKPVRRPPVARIVVLAAALLAAGLGLTPAANAAGPLTFGPAEPAFANLPAFISDSSNVPCYPEILLDDLPLLAFPVQYPNNAPHEFAYYDLRTPVMAIEGGGFAKFRLTIQGFGLEAGGTPIIRNFVRLTVVGAPEGTYGVLDDPSGALTGTTFDMEGKRAVVEVMALTPNATHLDDIAAGPITDLSIRTGTFTMVRNGAVVATATLDDFIGCAAEGPPVAGADPAPQAVFTFACGGLRCAFDGRLSTYGLDASLATRMWWFDDGTGATSPSLVHTFPAAGTYQVSLNVTTSLGLWSNVTQEVFVNDGSLPQPPGAAGPAATFEGVRTNNFLGILVDPTGPATVTGVSVSINGGLPEPLQQVNALEWRALSPPRNVLVVFHATLSDSTQATSETWVWPSFKPG